VDEVREEPKKHLEYEIFEDDLNNVKEQVRRILVLKHMLRYPGCQRFFHALEKILKIHRRP
jgi:hypothetical protein